MNRHRFITRACALLLCAAFFLSAFSACTVQSGEAQPTIISGMRITPQNQDDAGVAYDSGFYIHSERRLSKRELEKGLEVEPAISYGISATEDGFFLKPAEPLTPNTVYAFTFTESGGFSRTWAVQSRRPFSVLYSSPAPDAADVWSFAGIELNFSHPGVDPADYIEISPAVDYNIETRGRTVTLYPTTGYKPYTRYTVTVKQGLKSPLGDILAEDYRLSFTTTDRGNDSYQRGGSPVYLYGEYSETFLPDDPPVVRVGRSNNEDATSAVKENVTVSVSRFLGSKPYLEAITGRDAFIKNGGDPDEYRCSEDTLTHYVSFSTQFLESDWDYVYVVFPETLPAGWYAVTVTAKDNKGEEHTVQKLLQISSVSVYTQSVNGQTLVWLNDANTGTVIKGANVGLLESGSVAPALSAVTDSSGIAQLATGDRETGYLFAKVDADNEYVERIPLTAAREPSTSELYYSFLFKDRELYLPTDTVKLWGKLAPRSDAAVLPKALTLHLTTGSWLENEYVQETVAETPVTLQPNGSFTAEISYESLTSDGYNLRLMDDKDIEYCSTYISVYEYEKPIYQFTAASDKEFYTADDTVDYFISARFYSGNAVPGMTFETILNDKTYPVVTDSMGKATLRINEDGHFFDDQTSWVPYTLTPYLYSTGPEDQQYSLSPSAVIFPRDIMLTTQREQDGFEKTLTLFTNKVDTSNIKRSEEIFADYPNRFQGASVNIPVDVAVYRVDYLKEQYSSYYNPVDKRTVPMYYYSKKETLTKQYTVNTVNGTAVLNDLPSPTSSEQFYRIELTYKDTKGRTASQSEYIGYYQDLYQSSEIKRYRFANDKHPEGILPYWYNPYGGYEARYALGEKVRISLLENDAPVTGGTVLYTLVQDGMVKSGVSDSATVSFTQSEQYLPNLLVVGAYFDGRHIYPVDHCTVLFDSAERAVKLSAVPDKKQYKPGDTVQLAITATDRSGKPVATDVAVSVVDEALFSLRDQDLDPLSELYQSAYSHYPVTFASYNQFDFSRYPGGGKGGGDNVPPTGGGDFDKRNNFLDTAAFTVTRTDQNGKATASFTLPDNLTSWRITSAAVTDNLYAGAAITNITTTIPLFVSPVYNTTYIEGDSVAFTLRAYGDAIESGEDINYTVTVTGKKNQKETKTLAMPSGTTSAAFDFGMLAAGDYKVLFTAQSGKNGDSAEYAFTVKQSALEMPVSREITPAEASSIDAMKYPVWLGFYDSQYGEYIKTIQRLAAQYGDRADQRTAAAVASSLLKEYADDDALTRADLAETDFTEYQQVRGGVRVYSYDFPSTQLTARMAIAAPHLYNTQAMVSYLSEYLLHSWYDQSEVCAAVVGLAALKQPVLTDAKAMLKRAESLTDIDILNLCLALAYLGDTDGAVTAYNTHIAPYLVTAEYWSYYDTALATAAKPIYTEDGMMMEGYSGKGSSGYSTSTIMGANLQHTALIMLLAQQTGCADTEALLRYVRENSSYDVSTLPEQTAYLTHFVPIHTDTAVVRFNRGLLPTTLELKKGGIRYVPFNKSQLAKSNITTDGDVGITAMYTGLPNTLSSSPSAEITVVKSITRSDGGAVRVGDPARITLTVTLGSNAPTGRYDMSDWIPSALRYQNLNYGNEYSSGVVWLDSHEGQRLTMSFYHEGSQTQDFSGAPTTTNTYTITYYARCVTEGDSAVDSTYVVHAASGAVNYTPKGTLTTKDGAKPLTLSSK